MEIFITAVVSWHIKHMGLVLVGGRMNANISVQSSWIFTVHFSFSSELAPTASKMSICDLLRKTKVKVKSCLAAVSDRVTPCPCVVGMETSPGIQVPTW